MMIFAKDLSVKYKEHMGVVRFISSQYITICVKTYDHKSRDVCMLVYPDKWDSIEIIGDYETEVK